MLEKRKGELKKKIEEIEEIKNEKADLKKVIDEYLKKQELTHE